MIAKNEDVHIAALEQDNIPEALRARPQWVCWRYRERDGQRTKVPIAPANGRNARATTPSDWSSFDDAITACGELECDGVGFVFTEDDGCTGIDLDDCIDADGAISPEAQEIIDAFDSYTEVSPSGRGVKIFIQGVKPEGATCKTREVVGFKMLEVYDCDRFFCVTGRIVPGPSDQVEVRQGALDALCGRYLIKSPQVSSNDTRIGAGFSGSDEELIDRASSAANGAKFRALMSGDTSGHHGDDSSADLALCNMLAFWAGRDEARMDRIFRGSGLMRSKWDEIHGAQTYGQMTIRRAIRDCAEVYTGGSAVIHGPHSGPIDTCQLLGDPGLLPESALQVPGFIGDIMELCLKTAPYPNVTLAFCGALTLQAFLAGRCVRDMGDVRPNLYLLGLAHSASGKDWPRKLNTKVLHEVGLGHCLGDRLASGEGLQDALFSSPFMLLQTDEFDGLIQSINRSRDARYEALMSTLLTMYSASNGVFPMRWKAGMSEHRVINQPCLVLFGTAIPNHYYAAMSERMLTNGLFARMLILEAGPRGAGQEPTILSIPDDVLEIARYWADIQRQAQQSSAWSPRVVPATADAQAEMRALRILFEGEYTQAEKRGDAVATTVWGRANEMVRKLALLYAVSESNQEPQITAEGVAWAARIVHHQCRRMLFMAEDHAAENPFDELARKAIRHIRNSPGGRIGHSALLK